MNIVYDLVPETGMMRLKFKDSVINGFKDDTKIIFDKYILPMLAMNDKLCLTGSLSLKLLGFEPMEKVGDFDLGLTEEFTEDDYNSIKIFFGLRDAKEGYSWEEDEKRIPKFNPKSHMWQLYKEWIEKNNNGKDINMYFKMDIFSDEMIRKKDIISVFWDDFEIKMVHPSITLSYRMRYALDSRSSTSYKYWKRMDEFMKDAKPYYNLLRLIQKMVMRTHEHNANVEADKQKLINLKQLIKTREKNMDSFITTAFSEPIEF